MSGTLWSYVLWYLITEAASTSCGGLHEKVGSGLRRS